MGSFHVNCEVVDVRRPAKSVRAPKLLVDTGSEFSWVPEPILREAGIRVAKKDLRFLMANGQTITRSTGYAILRAAGFETVDEVVFGQPGDLSLLGSRTLEGFGASVDARKKRLVAAGPHPAAVGTSFTAGRPPRASGSHGRCQVTRSVACRMFVGLSRPSSRG
jgi:predicted aspartyl protease